MNGAQAPFLTRPAPAWVLRREGWLVSAVGWILLMGIPMGLGGLGMGSDTLNHHIYLGWSAEQHRFDRDFLGAGFQSLQYPYLYWPVYRMAVDGWTGQATGIVLASLQALVVWPVWRLARACMPGDTVFDLAMRALAVALGLLSCVFLSIFGSTMNDLLAALPLVWALALALDAAVDPRPTLPRSSLVLSGLCAGVAVAWKLSNGPLAILLPLLWMQAARGTLRRLQAVVLAGLAATVAFVLAYGYWGWLLWRYFGNPVFPFKESWFAPLRAWLGWAG